MRKILLLCLLGLSSASFAEEVEENAAFKFKSVCAHNSYKLETINSELLKLQRDHKTADFSRCNICEDVIQNGETEDEIIKALSLLLTSGNIIKLNKKDKSMLGAFERNYLDVVEYLKEQQFEFASDDRWQLLFSQEHSKQNWSETLANCLCQKEDEKESYYYNSLFNGIYNDVLVDDDDDEFEVEDLKGLMYLHNITKPKLRYLNFYKTLCKTYQQVIVLQNSDEKNEWWREFCHRLSIDIQNKKNMHEENLRKCNEILKDIEDRSIENEILYEDREGREVTLSDRVNWIIKIEKAVEKAYQELYDTLLENLIKLNNL